MDREKQQQATEVLSSRSAGSRGEQQTYFPPELFTEIAKHMPSDNPVETAKNLANIMRVSHGVKDAVQASPVGLFHERVKRLGNSARAVHGALIPEDGLPEHLGPGTGVHSVLPTGRTVNAGPLLKFQSSEAKTALVDHIVNMSSPRAQADVISTLAPHVGDLDAVQRTRLVDQTIQIFMEDGSSHDWARRSAGMALVSMHEHLDVTQKAKILDALVHDSGRAALYSEMTFHNETDWDSGPEDYHHTPERNLPLQKAIGAIEKSVDGLITDAPIRSDGQLHTAGKIAESIDKAYKDARAELMAAPGRRENSGATR
ncbi:hypothetical protein [Rhizobium rhizogenes]|uniref:hypothetical protein n=1 Tax=Rhizobium rhizogenes TaxID=359 RepID=UPI0022B70FDE|nr:hypothetical protein [Rhizobium rhizogenes]MCZ7448245.1 hypothetical protein [Rhizobium rhizogenes]MCZ7465906.1 hypothetical protein [Rhizobium rhizogenes]